MPPDTRQPKCLTTGLNPRVFCEDTVFPGSCALPCLPVTNLEKACEAEQKPFYFYPQPQGKQSAHVFGLPGFAPSPHVAFGSLQKRLLVFDHTENQTQLLRFCPFPSQLPFTAPVKPVRPTDPGNVGKWFKGDGFVPGKVLLHEESDENRGNDEEIEMHEDTEEINALLYSDEEDDYGDSDDEVMSTGHSPLQVIDRNDEKDADNFGYPNKRQKYLDGGYNKSSLMDTATSVKFEEPSQKTESTPKSSHAYDHELVLTLGHKQSSKDKIRRALRILECIVPGAKGKEALMVIDDAIDHLKLLKQNAKSFGVNFC